MAQFIPSDSIVNADELNVSLRTYSSLGNKLKLSDQRESL